MTTVFAELILITPRRTGKVVVGEPDPARPAYTVRGVLDDSAAPTRPTGSGTRQGAITQLVAPILKLSVARDQFLISAPPKAGDVITAAERAGSPSYRISSVEPSGTTFLEFILNPEAV